MKPQRFFLKTSLPVFFRGLKTLIICACICAVNPGNTAAGVWISAPGNCNGAVNPDPVTLSGTGAGSPGYYTGASGFWADPVAGLYEFAQKAGQFFQRSTSASSTILILLIVISIFSASLTYFGIIVLLIYKRDES